MASPPPAADRALAAELLARHDRPGPRYTSYPTAVEFGEGVDADTYERLLAEADREPDAPLSLYVHFPFCEERCLFCGCHVIATRRRERTLPYLELLRREMALVAERLPHRRGLSQLHLGGGTPTYHEPAELAALIGSLFAHFRPLPGAELAVEVDPRVTRAAHLDALCVLGFRRLSLGVQDLQPDVQAAIGRHQTLEQTRRTVRAARERGFDGVNVDLIYGLPRQTVAGLERTIDEVIALGADRAAVYSFAWVPAIRGHQRRIDEADLPGREAKIELFTAARERFLAAGYVPIGMDHFARPDDELAVARREGRLRRNFQGYTTVPAEDVVGLGLSAIGDLRGAYVQNHKKLSAYGRALEAGRLPVERGVLLDRDDRLRRALIHDLMCNFRVDVRALERDFAVDFGRYFADDLARLSAYEAEGLVTIGPDELRATPRGELLVRNLALCFDRYRQSGAASGRPTFSRTV